MAASGRPGAAVRSGPAPGSAAPIAAARGHRERAYTAFPMTSDEIRRTFTSFFEERDHLRLPSAPLIPAELDPSALFTVAETPPLNPSFLGRERPPHPRVTTCQKTFRTVDIEIIVTTARHLT